MSADRQADHRAGESTSPQHTAPTAPYVVERGSGASVVWPAPEPSAPYRTASPTNEE